LDNSKNTEFLANSKNAEFLANLKNAESLTNSKDAKSLNINLFGRLEKAKKSAIWPTRKMPKI
jgi:hypothetical protein